MATRLLAIDLDGTLLTGERTPHPENVLALKRASEAGIQIVLASGRIAASVRDFSDKLGLDQAMICSNGGHVQGLLGEELLHLSLDRKAIDITLGYTSQAGVHTSVYTRDQLYFLGDSEWGDMYRQRVRIVKPEISTVEAAKQMNVLKIILIDQPSQIKQHRVELEKVLDQSIAALTESEPEYLEVLSAEANKGKGLQVLSESMGLQQHETAAIGDYLNDLEMIQWAGVGAAMGNAVEELKSAANMIMPTNEEAGVARFIDYLIERNDRLG